MVLIIPVSTSIDGRESIHTCTYAMAVWDLLNKETVNKYASNSSQNENTIYIVEPTKLPKTRHAYNDHYVCVPVVSYGG